MNWISVKDQLPEHYENVLLKLYDGTEIEGYRQLLSDGYRETKSLDKIPVNNVVRWKPKNPIINTNQPKRKIMKSELTTVQPEPNPLPKLMKNEQQNVIILATSQQDDLITGTVIWAGEGLNRCIGKQQDDWYALNFEDLPRHECVILSNA